MIKNEKREIITLSEGDILLNDGNSYIVALGEVTIYSDKTIDIKDGQLNPISGMVIRYALSESKTVFDMESMEW